MKDVKSMSHVCTYAKCKQLFDHTNFDFDFDLADCVRYCTSLVVQDRKWLLSCRVCVLFTVLLLLKLI